MHFNGSPLADRIDAFVGLALHIHPFGPDPEFLRHIRSDRLLVRREFGTLQYHRGIDIFDSKSIAGGQTDRLTQKDRGISGVVPGIIVGKELADVLTAQCTQNGIGHGVIERVAIGMGHWTAIVFKSDTADDQRSTAALRVNRLQPMQVVAVSDPKLV